MESDDDLQIATKSYDRLMDSTMKYIRICSNLLKHQLGYKEGAEDGSDTGLQDGFKLGFAEGMKISFILGQYKGLMTTCSKNVEIPENIKNILNMTRLGSCYICENKLANQKSEQEKPIEEVLNCQLNHVKQQCQVLYDFFNPIMKESGININNLKL